MREGWTYKKLGDVFVSINNGANIKQIKGASGIPITRIETLSNDIFNRDRMGYANIDDVSPYTSYVLNEGDILMSHINSMKFLGRAVAYVKKDEETIIHGMNLLRLVPASDVLSPFMVYQFQTKFFRNQILLISHQSVNQASFNTTNLKGLNVIVPPLSEQKRIVSRLDSAFAHIDALKANAKKQLDDAKALFQKALEKAMEPKEGWEEKKLGYIYDVRDGTHDSPKYHETGFPLVTSKNLRRGILDMTNVNFISESDYKSINNRSKVDVGDVLFAMIGTIGNPVYVDKAPNYAIKNMALFKVPTNQSGEFLRYYLLNDKIILKMQTESKGTTQKFVSLGYLRNFCIMIPPLSEQQAIVAQLDQLSEKVKRLQEIQEKTIKECDALKQAILREVFE